MRTTGYIFTSILIALFAAPLTAQVNDTYVIAAAGNTAGLQGTRWVTDFDLFNPQPYTLRVTLVFLPTGGEAGDTVKFDVFSNENFSIENVVGTVFGRVGTGSLLVATFPEDNPGVPDDFLARSFLVSTRTYNNAPSGTFGQLVPGVWAGLLDFATDQISSVAHGITNDVSTTTGFRANVGAVNLGRTSVTLRVSVYDGEGNTLLNRAPFTIPPQGHVQDRLPATVFYGSVEFFLDDPTLDGVVFPYVSVIDNRSGDPVYRSPVLLADPAILFKMAKEKMELGKRIDTEVAREVVRSTARDLGVVTLARSRSSS
ncbi:MAG TPA: hypothetical protein VMT00_14870 [Thermoanaerobaculia bacterium]|nr:hypothetical protein [Thermoanaerobaculia bacterium]